MNFHLAANVSDPVRSDTTIYSWLVRTIPGVVAAPEYFHVGSERGTFQLIKRVAPPEKHPSLLFIRLPIKFVPSGSSKSGTPERIDKLMSEHDKPPNVDSVMRPLRNSKTQRRVV